MESRKVVLMNLHAGQQWKCRQSDKAVNMWEEEGEMNWESSTETCIFGSVQSLSHVWLFVTPWTPAHQASLSITNSKSLLKLMSIEQWCHPTISSSVSPSLPALKLSQHHGLFKCVSSSHEVAKVLNFSFNISLSNEHPGLISLRMDWLDLLAVQGPLKSLLQHHSSKASILRRSAFFIDQLSRPYMTTGKTIALTNGPLLAK